MASSSNCSLVRVLSRLFKLRSDMVNAMNDSWFSSMSLLSSLFSTSVGRATAKKRTKDQCFLGKVLCHNNSHRKVEATFQLNICAVLFCVSNVAINKKWHSPASGQLLAFSRRLDSGECYEMEIEMLLNVD